MTINTFNLGIIGLGYVGLPLAVEFGKVIPVQGFDINVNRIHQLQKGEDVTLEITADELASSKNLEFTDSVSSLQGCNIIIVTVPTPVDDLKRPDFSALTSACELLAECNRRNLCPNH